MRLGEGIEMTLNGVSVWVMPFAQQGRIVMCSVFRRTRTAWKPLGEKCIVLELEQS